MSFCPQVSYSGLELPVSLRAWHRGVYVLTVFIWFLRLFAFVETFVNAFFTFFVETVQEVANRQDRRVVVRKLKYPRVQAEAKKIL